MNFNSGSVLLRYLSSATSHSGQGPSLCGPAVRFLIMQYGLEGRNLEGSGPKNNVLKSDVILLIKKENLSPIKNKSSDSTKAEKKKVQAAQQHVGRKPTRDFNDIPLTNIRSTIAKRLSQSKQQIPHEYQAADIRVNRILAFRQQLKDDGITLSINDFVIKAAALALRAVPEINVRFEKDQLVRLPTVDISVAVATSTGLITPIIKNADIIGVQSISNKVKELSHRAKENKLQPNEFQGGSFTISNLGMFGSVSNFTAIINPPQCAILTVGGTRTELVSNDGNLELQQLMGVTLCFDGRAICEEKARDFLLHVSEALTDPDILVVEPISPALGFDFSRLL